MHRDWSLTRRACHTLLSSAQDLIWTVIESGELTEDERDLLRESHGCVGAIVKRTNSNHVASDYERVRNPEKAEPGMVVLLDTGVEPKTVVIDEVVGNGVHLDGGTYLSFDLLDQTRALIVARPKEEGVAK